MGPSPGEQTERYDHILQDILRAQAEVGQRGHCCDHKERGHARVCAGRPGQVDGLQDLDVGGHQCRGRAQE